MQWKLYPCCEARFTPPPFLFSIIKPPAWEPYISRYSATLYSFFSPSPTYSSQTTFQTPLMSQTPNMSAPSIPNLLSLRGGRGGSRGRGRASGRGGLAQSSQAQHDATIQGTDTDAAMSRLSAVELGYLDDPYAPYFVHGQSPSRRLPIINRGEIVAPPFWLWNLMVFRHIHKDNGFG